MRTSIVLRDHLDVFVASTSVPLVLDSEIGEVHALVKVRQVVLASPLLDLAFVAIGSPVAVGAAAVVLLQPLLILTLQFLFEDDAAHFSTLLAEPFLLAQVGAIELGV